MTDELKEKLLALIDKYAKASGDRDIYIADYNLQAAAGRGRDANAVRKEIAELLDKAIASTQGHASNQQIRFVSNQPTPPPKHIV